MSFILFCMFDQLDVSAQESREKIKKSETSGYNKHSLWWCVGVCACTFVVCIPIARVILASSRHVVCLTI